MEIKVQKNLIDYFSYFEEYYHTSKKSFADCQKYSTSINKLLVRCNKIKRAVTLDSPLEKHTGLENRLCAKLYDIISEETQNIRDCLSTLEELLEKLLNKYRVLHENIRNLDSEAETLLTKGTPIQPPLKKLIKYSNDTITYANQFCVQIKTALTVLALKKTKAQALKDNFKVFPDSEREILAIIAHTSFLSDSIDC